MKEINILLVEDNEGDILLTKEAFEEARLKNEIQVVRDGQEAIDYLSAGLNGDSLPLPDIILLDINLPKMNGHEVLAIIKNSNDFKHIPVIILTTSSAEDDVLKSYQNHANCYVSKPVVIEDFMKVIATFEEFWLSIVKLPNKITK